ncbi:MAG: ATP-binding protein [Oligoflexia bacterium]|nr:ATP-binding protein [Oligoflexia bacterium]
MRTSFGRATIRTRLTLVMMSVVLLVLGFTGTLLILVDASSERERLLREVKSLSEVIETGSTAALAFRDSRALDELLASIGTIRSLAAACIYDETGMIVGSYLRTESPISCPPEPGSAGLESVGRNLWFRRVILLERRKIGTLVMVSDLTETYAKVRADIGVILVVLGLAAVLAFVLSGFAQRIISSPILRLASTARTVTHNRDTSIRASPESGAEMIDLIDSFNAMLAKIGEHDRERERLLQEARDAIRVRDDFMSIASHELRTPITPLKSQVQLIQRLVEKRQLASYPPERLESLLGVTDRQLSRLSSLVDDLLDVTRITAGRLELQRRAVRLGAVVRDVAERFLPQMGQFGSQVALELEDVEEGLWDRLRLEQVVTNLLTNALKYGEGKPVTLRTSTGLGSAVLTVQDRGLGVDPKDQAKIFERFERAVSSGHFGGLGLGLYITRQIVQAHEGEIGIESEPGKGSRFTVRLPLRRGREEREDLPRAIP